jgi:hypothetical protein
MNYKFVVEDEVFHLFTQLSTRKRDKLLRLFQELADQAPMPATRDYEDAVGRPIFRKKAGGWTLWFWYDCPVYEVRIVDIEHT